MLNWDSAWNLSKAAVMNPGQRPHFSPPLTQPWKGVDNSTRRLLSQVTVRSSGLLGGWGCCLTSWRLDSDLWSTVCVMWGNVMDDFSLGNMTNESTLSHSEYWYSLSCSRYIVVIYMIRWGLQPLGRDIFDRSWGPCSLHYQCAGWYIVIQCNPTSRCFSCTPKLL